jgi:DNA-binding Lrp family transcriptional regulator
MRKELLVLGEKIKAINMVLDELPEGENLKGQQKVEIYIGDQDNLSTGEKWATFKKLEDEKIIKKLLLRTEEETDEHGSGIGVFVHIATVSFDADKTNSTLTRLKEERKWCAGKNIFCYGGLKFNSVTGEARYGNVKAILDGKQALFLKTLLHNEIIGGNLDHNALYKIIYSNTGRKNAAKISDKKIASPKDKLRFILNEIRKKLNIGKKKGQNKDIFGSGPGGYMLKW